MGSDEFYPEERPVREVTVGAFAIDRHPVTVAGSLVFQPTTGPLRLDDARAWWAYVPGACWTAPEGPGSHTRGRHRHPVTHVAYEDALAFAQWASKDLPAEAEWEYAARGGLARNRFAWGDEITVRGRMMANWWQGQSPWQNTLEDGYERTSPVGAFQPNGYGLYDVCGNVWEWTKDLFEDPRPGRPCCAPNHALDDPPGIERRAIRGGSHLSAPTYCLRFRPAARQSETVDASTSHIGSRCVSRM